jgi:hypothetical protein
MRPVLDALFLLAQESPGNSPERGENPSDIGGILIIAGIAVAFLLVFLFAMRRRRTNVRD